MHGILSLKWYKMEDEIDDKTISSDEESCNRRFLERMNPVSLKYPLGCFTLVKRIFLK